MYIQRTLILTVCLAWTQVVWSKVEQISATRNKGEPFELAAQKYLSRHISSKNPTAYDSAKKFRDVSWGNTTTWNSNYQEMLFTFRKITDDRFIQHPHADQIQSNFPRRPSWMYPDDGCFARAEMMALRLKEMNHITPTKIFAFGDLSIASANAIGNETSWWFHVAIAYEHDGVIYVFDPAIEPLFPLDVQSWLGRMNKNPQDLKISLCDNLAYDADSFCENNKPTSLQKSLGQQKYYLNMEWQRLESLDRNPEHELGDFPPWAN